MPALKDGLRAIFGIGGHLSGDMPERLSEAQKVVDEANARTDRTIEYAAAKEKMLSHQRWYMEQQRLYVEAKAAEERRLMVLQQARDLKTELVDDLLRRRCG